MENASWLVVTYSLSMCAIQPTVRYMNRNADLMLEADIKFGSMVN